MVRDLQAQHDAVLPGGTTRAVPGQHAKVYRTELSPLSFLRRSAYLFPDRIAVVDGNRATSVTYSEFEARVNRLASRLRRSGLQKGDRVAFLCPNIPPMLEAHFAVPSAGGILVSINSRLSSTEIVAILSHANPRFLFVDDELAPLVASLDTTDIEVVRVQDTGVDGDPYEEYLAGGSPEALDSWLVDEEEAISLCYTSGTTGPPKGVVYTHRGAYLNALANVIETGLNAESVFLWAHAMFHCNGWCFPWSVAAVAGTQICIRKPDPAVVWGLLSTQGVTHFHGGPTLHNTLVNHPKAHRVGRPVTVAIGGSPPSPTLLTRLGELNFRPVHVYGLTETYAPITICDWRREWEAMPSEEQARRLARQGQGRIVADLVRVVDDGMDDVPCDGQTLGEVVMRGNIVMKGYYKDPGATAAACQGGWFHSGDLAVCHPDGTIELRDRKKDLIISGGENVSTIEVEQAVAAHPAVLECAVVAIPDETWGERPKAFVALKPGHHASAEDLIDFCRERLTHFKCPAAVEFGELPKTATGKVQKFVLREKEWVGYEKRIN